MMDISELPDFKSWQDYSNFQRSIKSESRYIRSPETESFLAAVRKTCRQRKVLLKQDIWWRAQLDHGYRDVGNDLDIPCAARPERMIPKAEFATDGRGNARGIPVLYLASSEKTAIAEVRPWVGSLVSTAEFKALPNLNIIDCAANLQKTHIFLTEPEVSKRTEAVWSDIDAAFARPVSVSDTHVEYAPTQILAELFKDEGFDGIGYKSSCCDDGWNLILFDVNAAKLKSCGLQKVEMIDLNSKEEDLRYFQNC